MLSSNDAKYVQKIKQLWLNRYSKVGVQGLKEEIDFLRQRGLNGINAEKHAVALVYQAFKVSFSEPQTLFDEQVAAARHLLNGRIVEMANGEGKTFVATTAACVSCLLPEDGSRAKTVYIATQNDYLAKRDASWLAPLYSSLGLSVSVLTDDEPSWHRLVNTADSFDMEPISIEQAHQSHVVHCTLCRLIFDCLNDTLAYSEHERSVIHRDFLVIDEADSVLLDQADKSFNLINPTESDRGHINVNAKAIVARQVAQELVIERDFVVDNQSNTVTITEPGLRHAESLLNKTLFLDEYDKPWHWYLRDALLAEHILKEGEEYRIIGSQIKTYDEQTGRFTQGRFGGGLHEALEAKVGLPPRLPGSTSCSTTPKHVLSSFEKYGGLTASANSVSGELRRLYGLKIVSIPRRKKSGLHLKPPIPCRSRLTRLCMTVLEVSRHTGPFTPILVSTQNELDALCVEALLRFLGFKVNVARPDEPDSEPNIVVRAGDPWRITVTSKLLSRGTEIKIAPEISIASERKNGEQECGLYVIGCGYSEISAREDDQFIGRTARRGALGIARFIFSWMDPFPRHVLPDWNIRLVLNLAEENDGLPGILDWALKNARRDADRNSALRRNRILDKEILLQRLRTPWLSLRLLLSQPDGAKALSIAIIRAFSKNFAQDPTGSGRQTPGGLSLEELIEITGLEVEATNNYRKLSQMGKAKLIEDALLAELSILEKEYPDFSESIAPKIRDGMDAAWSSLLHTIDPVVSSLTLAYRPHMPPKWVLNNHILSYWRKEIEYFSAFFVVTILGRAKTVRLRHPTEVEVSVTKIRAAASHNERNGGHHRDQRIEQWLSKRPSLLAQSQTSNLETDKGEANHLFTKQALNDAVSNLETALKLLSDISTHSETLQTVYRLILANTSEYPECQIAISQKLNQLSHELPDRYQDEVRHAQARLNAVLNYNQEKMPIEMALLKARLLLRLGDYQAALSTLKQCSEKLDEPTMRCRDRLINRARKYMMADEG